MNYTELRNRGQRHWSTRGPDLEGEAGYCLLDGRMYYWTYLYGEADPQVEHDCSVSEFVRLHGESDDRVLRQMSKELQNLDDSV